ncbi:WG repeat-containing protein [Streptomyces sp. NPDC001933]|uniref:WG repeat-containing protein n=1 Tax=Streptomyces sp. NPDC001933 TaxID=3364626 RepID=UPI0036776794
MQGWPIYLGLLLVISLWAGRQWLERRQVHQLTGKVTAEPPVPTPDRPFSYGLIDTEGRWRIPMGQRFIGMRPFRDGTAEVILNTEDGSYGGPWTGIDTQGRSVDRPS